MVDIKSTFIQYIRYITIIAH
ncbi:hypothetical protein O604_02579, partial [Staphylococcus aureus M0558]